MHDTWKFWRELPPETLRGIWFDGIGSFPEQAILLSGNIPEDAVGRQIERLRTRKTFGEGLMSKFALADPRAANDKLVSVLRGGELVPEAHDADAAMRNQDFASFLGGNLDWPIAATALLLSPATSARKLDAISRLRPELLRACAAHQNGCDLPTGGDIVIDGIRARRHGICLVGGSGKQCAGEAQQLVI